jgi:hypothetical protein
MGKLAIVIFSSVGLLSSHGSIQVQMALRVHSHELRWQEGPLDCSKVDWTLFPKAYGVLSSQSLMFPVDVSDWPVKIDERRQLFVDNWLVAESEGVRRTVHQPEKVAGNPILTGMEPWEVNNKLILIDVVRDLQLGQRGH